MKYFQLYLVQGIQESQRKKQRLDIASTTKVIIELRKILNYVSSCVHYCM